MMTPPDSTQRKSRGFSVLELVIAVAIVLIIATVVMPTYRSISTAGKSVECLNRLRHIYLSSLAFTEDYNGRLPPGLTKPPYIDPDKRYHYNVYWWNQAYLGRYVLSNLQRRKDSAGMLSQAEAEAFNCPARHVEGPDKPMANGNPAVSYIMTTRGASVGHVLRAIENKSKLIYITEGRGSTVWDTNFKTGEIGGTNNENRRLRRYHNGAINLLFFDGHVELSTQSDEELLKMLPART